MSGLPGRASVRPLLPLLTFRGPWPQTFHSGTWGSRTEHGHGADGGALCVSPHPPWWLSTG